MIGIYELSRVQVWMYWSTYIPWPCTDDVHVPTSIGVTWKLNLHCYEHGTRQRAWSCRTHWDLQAASLYLFVALGEGSQCKQKTHSSCPCPNPPYCDHLQSHLYSFKTGDQISTMKVVDDPSQRGGWKSMKSKNEAAIREPSSSWWKYVSLYGSIGATWELMLIFKLAWLMLPPTKIMCIAKNRRER